MVRRKSTPPKKSPVKRKKHTTEIIIGGKYFKMNTKLLGVIRNLQRNVNLLIPKASISRVIREVMFDARPNCDMRITVDALKALHEATEHYAVQYFQDANMLAMHRRAITLKPKDMQLIAGLRGKYGTF